MSKKLSKKEKEDGRVLRDNENKKAEELARDIYSKCCDLSTQPYDLIRADSSHGHYFYSRALYGTRSQKVEIKIPYSDSSFITVTIEHKDSMRIKLMGDKEQILNFLSKLDQSWMTEGYSQ